MIVPVAMGMPVITGVLVGVLVHPQYSTGFLPAVQPARRLPVIGKYDNSVPRIR
jgi:hypothetical protein